MFFEPAVQTIRGRIARALQSAFQSVVSAGVRSCSGYFADRNEFMMDRRYVQLDPKKLDYLRLKKGWSVEELVEFADRIAVDPVDGNKAGLNKRTVKSVLNGEQTFVRSGRILAHLLGAENLISVLQPQVFRDLGPPSRWEQPLSFFSTVGEWDVMENVEGEQQTSNGLCYDVWKVRHRHIPDRFGRGKCYDLSQLSTKERARLKNYLTRHSQICDRLGTHPNIARNWSAIEWEHGEFWWIIDEWVDGEKLSTLLEAHRLPAATVPDIMRQTASALHAMHQAGIVRRELSPRFVIIRRSDSRAVFSDFELAKLLDGAPSVSPKKAWPDDPYRAVEVDGDAPIDVRADIYSWGRILVHVATGQLPAKGQEANSIGNASLPPAVRRLALACVALARSERPASMDEVLTGIKKWS